jgi:3-hydroxyisobutyrate dehydrogenase
MVSVAVVGVGDMGSEMIPHLLAAHFDVTAYDVDPEKLKAAVNHGARRSDSPAAAARQADVVLSLVMSADIESAHFGENGILAGLKPGAVLVIGSTTTPDIVRGIKNNAPENADVVDAPIVGGVRYARERSVTFLVGGSQPGVDKAEVVLSTLGKVEKVGEFGSGVSYKLITNVLVMAAEAGLREALDLTDILGGDYETALRLFGIGPMAAVVGRALDESNPRPLRASAEDFDVLLSAIKDKSLLPISAAGRNRLWTAVTAKSAYGPMFVDLTRKTTALPEYQKDTDNETE